MTKSKSAASTIPVKPGRGGKREGAGRPTGSAHIDPQLRRVKVQVRLPKYIDDWLRAQPVPAGRVIEIALSTLNIPRPGEEE